MNRRLIGILFALACLGTMVVASCGGSSKASCSEAMNHFYDQGCVIVYGEEQISLSEAISGCEDSKADARECGCLDVYQDTLNCLEKTTEEDCAYKCSADFDDWNYCIGNCE